MSLPHRRMLCREDTTSVLLFVFIHFLPTWSIMTFDFHETLVISSYVMKLSRGACHWGGPLHIIVISLLMSLMSGEREGVGVIWMDGGREIRLRKEHALSCFGMKDADVRTCKIPVQYYLPLHHATGMKSFIAVNANMMGDAYSGNKVRISRECPVSRSHRISLPFHCEYAFTWSLSPLATDLNTMVVFYQELASIDQSSALFPARGGRWYARLMALLCHLQA
ncbi:hypothetical protein LZ30DRAFT_719584 [Colletotrichum cereale]|nr:hypothetical protein LZ30DRAFT_719584 [Colletotrichum cereale]